MLANDFRSSLPPILPTPGTRIGDGYARHDAEAGVDNDVKPQEYQENVDRRLGITNFHPALSLANFGGDNEPIAIIGMGKLQVLCNLYVGMDLTDC